MLPNAPCARKYWIYGPPAVGKSTLGRALARLLDLPFVDLDERLAARLGMPLSAFFAKYGEGAFREAEQAAIKEVAAAKGEAVIALGGGALLRAENRALAETTGMVLTLSAPMEVILRRAEQQAGQRPLVAAKSEAERAQRMRTLLKKRAAHYASFPLRLLSTGTPPDELAWQAAVKFGRFQMKAMQSPHAPKGSSVFVVRDGLDFLGECVARLSPKGVVALVGDDIVMGLYGDRARESLRNQGLRPVVLPFPAGEKSKNLLTAHALWQRLAQSGAERGSVVVALGGGISTDLGGFVASAYMRGVKWVAVPTSLLGMIDASIGGKTGVDLPQGKNLVGAFYPPAVVLADPETLSTLPEAEFRNGMAEFVKHGVIGAPELFALAASRNRAAVIDAVARAMAVKVRVVEDDPYERGRRAALNLGHTIGHGVEAASGYGLRHGEAVAVGMVGEAALAERLGLANGGLRSQISEVLEEWGLPVALPRALSPEMVWNAMQADKKKAAGKLLFSLPRAVGHVEVGVAVPPGEVMAVLEALRGRNS